MPAALMTACGGQKEEDAGGAFAPERVEALAGSTLAGGSTLEVTDCAVMVCYSYANEDGTQEGCDALQAEIEAYAEEQGYAAITTQGEGDKVYAVMVSEDLSTVSVMVLGTADSPHPSVESGGSRRFAGCNELWSPLDGGDWQVVSVEEQDYYEEAGEQYPCYFMILTPAA